MNRLLKADFSRLFKSLIFKLGMIFSVGFALVMVIASYIDFKVNAQTYAEYGYTTLNADDFLFTGGFFMMFAVAVFIGIFVGTDYSDGTIRNKIMVGHRRGSIYLANYVVCYAATLIFNFACIITVLAAGMLLFGNTAIELSAFFVNMGFMIITSAALNALFLFLAMLINNKAAASVTLLSLAIVLWFSAMLIVTRLDTQEYYQDAYHLNEAGEMCSVAQKEFTQYFPKPGWVEHDAEEIWSTQLEVAKEAMANVGATAADIGAIGITNQRETTIVWD